MYLFNYFQRLRLLSINLVAKFSVYKENFTTFGLIPKSAPRVDKRFKKFDGFSTTKHLYLLIIFSLFQTADTQVTLASNPSLLAFAFPNFSERPTHNTPRERSPKSEFKPKKSTHSDDEVNGSYHDDQ